MSNIVAVFCGFEYLHDAVMLQRHGKYGLKKFANRLQPKAVSLDAVMDHARSLGQVVHAEAFGHWQFMSRYATPMRLENVQLVQVFPEEQKGAADIFPTLSTRVKQYLETNEEVNSVLFIGLDDDYSGLVEDVKTIGCQVYGLGCESLRDGELKSTLDGYTDYHTLDGVDAKPALTKSASRSRGDLYKYYLRVAAQQGVRMPPPSIMWIGIDIYASFIDGYTHFESFKELDDECYEQLVQDVPDASMTEVKKIRQVLFKCYLFRPSNDGRISFQENIKGLTDIENCYFDLMIRRIAQNLNEETDYEALSKALTGEVASAERLEKMHQTIMAETDKA